MNASVFSSTKPSAQRHASYFMTDGTKKRKKLHSLFLKIVIYFW